MLYFRSETSVLLTVERDASLNSFNNIARTLSTTTAVLGRHRRKSSFIQPFTGSSLERKKQYKKAPKKEIIKEPDLQVEKEAKPRVMSSRTKSKIRKKLLALAQLYKRLTFVTLTFVNKVMIVQE